MMLKYSLIVLSLLSSGCAPMLYGYLNASGTWQRIDEKTLRFVGSMDSQTHQRFLEAITPETKTLIVQTGGGDVEGGLAVGQEIFDRQLDLIVDGLCASSCSNYWFVAAKNKTVPEGSWVGYHGNPMASLAYYTQEEQEVLKAYVEEFTKRETAFYKQIGVSTELMTFSVLVTNTFDKSNYLPSPDQLRCYGVKNVEMVYPETVDGLFAGDEDAFVTTREAEENPELAKGLCSDS